MLLYFDGFDHYATATGAGNRLYERAPDLWGQSALTPQTDHAVTNTMPILGSRGLQMRWQAQNSSTNTAGLYHRLPRTPASGETWSFGFHFYMTTIPGGVPGAASGKSFFGFSGGSGGATHNFTIPNTGQIQFRPGNPSTAPSATSVGSLSAGVLYHIEIRITFHASAGSYDIRVNGAPFFSGAGVAFLPASRSHLALGATANAAQDVNLIHYDNLYIADDSGSLNNDWIGERVVYTRFPDADTAQADWSLSTGSDGYDLLDDVPPDGATNYIESATVGDQSTFEVEVLSNNDIIPIGVQTVIQAQKIAAGTSELSFGAVAGGVEDLGDPVNLTQDQFLYFSHVSEVNPSTGLPWTPAELNAMEVTVVRST